MLEDSATLVPAQVDLEYELLDENPDYLVSQLITYLGNKRTMLAPIRAAVEGVQERLGKDELRIFDGFSGSGVVSRMLRQFASELIVNDFEDYAFATSACYMTNRSEVDQCELQAAVKAINAEVDGKRPQAGFIRRLYAPADPNEITPEDRVFYTAENAYRLDAYRQLLDHETPHIRKLLLGPLLSEASIHANTAGVFKGFYKDRDTGIGKFGGTGADALDRIMAPIVLTPPILSNIECDYEVYQDDTNVLAADLEDLDVAYFDPPYNQHPYGSNYFMLNLLVNYEEPTDVSHVAGIPSTWKRSDYNSRPRALPSLRELIDAVDASFVILSFNDEGFVAPAELRELLGGFGAVTEYRQSYATFRGSRNLNKRNLSVTEHVYVIEKS